LPNKTTNMKKIFLSLIALSLTCLAMAQDKPGFSFSFNHLAISVKDLNASAKFYADVLQLKEITNRSKLDGIRWFAFGNGQELHLISIIKEPVTINKALHLGLTSPAFDEFMKVLEVNKVVYSDWPGTPNKVTVRADGIKQLYFQDPDGYWIEVNNTAQK
jgi:lactoylglutathione lyase